MHKTYTYIQTCIHTHNIKACSCHYHGHAYLVRLEHLYITQVLQVDVGQILLVLRLVLCRRNGHGIIDNDDVVGTHT